jgi:hypothetical protein
MRIKATFNEKNKKWNGRRRFYFSPLKMKK